MTKELKPHPEIDRGAKIVKDMSKPAPGDYKFDEAFDKTQSVNIMYKVPAGKIRNFVDEYKKFKNYLPAIGTYDVTNKVLDRVTRSSPLKIKRH